ncbi:MAG: YaiI/YqxD family protein [Pseudomonadales bacterium]|nr:YaiI/YqxD family protein [Pseudomonadales bacterium]
MRVWVDADACPRPVKEILYRAAHRRGIEVILVANSVLAVPRTPNVRAVTVPQGFDAADDYIVDEAVPGDLVITQDIPLGAKLVENGVAVTDPRGNEMDAQNAGERLALRNMMDEMRSTGAMTGGPVPYGDREKQAFANTFDRMLARLKQRRFERDRDGRA